MTPHAEKDPITKTKPLWIVCSWRWKSNCVGIIPLSRKNKETKKNDAKLQKMMTIQNQKDLGEGNPPSGRHMTYGEEISETKLQNQNTIGILL